jgi:hypothetical protein
MQEAPRSIFPQLSMVCADRFLLPVVDVDGEADEPEAHDAVRHRPADVVRLLRHRHVACRGRCYDFLIILIIFKLFFVGVDVMILKSIFAAQTVKNCVLLLYINTASFCKWIANCAVFDTLPI